MDVRSEGDVFVVDLDRVAGGMPIDGHLVLDSGSVMAEDLFPQIVDEFEDGERLFRCPLERDFEVDLPDIGCFHGCPPA